MMTPKAVFLPVLPSLPEHNPWQWTIVAPGYSRASTAGSGHELVLQREQTLLFICPVWSQPLRD